MNSEELVTAIQLAEAEYYAADFQSNASWSVYRSLSKTFDKALEKANADTLVRNLAYRRLSECREALDDFRVSGWVVVPKPPHSP